MDKEKVRIKICGLRRKEDILAGILRRECVPYVKEYVKSMKDAVRE